MRSRFIHRLVQVSRPSNLYPNRSLDVDVQFQIDGSNDGNKTRGVQDFSEGRSSGVKHTVHLKQTLHFSGRSRISRGGHGLPRRLCFEHFVCRNERIWTLRGRAPDTPPRSANGCMFASEEHVYVHLPPPPPSKTKRENRNFPIPLDSQKTFKKLQKMLSPGQGIEPRPLVL